MSEQTPHVDPHDVRRIPDPEEGYDRAEPAARQIFIFTAITVVLLVVMIVGIQVFFNQIWDTEVSTRVLQVPSEDLKNVHNREDAALGQYKMLDRAKGTVNLPISRAMELFAKEAGEGKLFYPAKPVTPKAEDPTADNGGKNTSPTAPGAVPAPAGAAAPGTPAPAAPAAGGEHTPAAAAPASKH